MLEYIKNYGDSVARENIFALTPLLWLFLWPDQCSCSTVKSSVCFVMVTTSHEHYSRRKPAPGKWAVGTLPSCYALQLQTCLLVCVIHCVILHGWITKSYSDFLIKGKSTKSDIIRSVFFCDIRRSHVFLWRIPVYLVLAQKTCFSPEGRPAYARKGT